jgi:hypothetical protein
MRTEEDLVDLHSQVLPDNNLEYLVRVVQVEAHDARIRQRNHHHAVGDVDLFHAASEMR